MTTIKRTNVVVGAEGQDLPIPIDSQAPRAVILTGPGFQDHDVIYCYYRCLEQGYQVDIATPGATPVVGKYTVPLNGKMDKTGTALISFEDLKVDDYDAVILTGGYEAPGRVRRDQNALTFLREMDAANKIIAGLCHGPWIMISANVLRDRNVCAYIDMKDDMVNSGAKVINARVVRDGNIITASYYAYVGEFMQQVFEAVTEMKNSVSTKEVIAV